MKFYDNSSSFIPLVLKIKRQNVKVAALRLTARKHRHRRLLSSTWNERAVAIVTIRHCIGTSACDLQSELVLKKN